MSKLDTSTRLPASWNFVPLKELGNWSGGGTPSKAKSQYWQGGTIPWVSPKDMKTERISDSEDHITKEAVSHSTASLINADSVLIVTRSGILRHTLPVAVNSVPVTINQDLKALTPRNGIMAEYVAWALRAFGRDILNTCSKQGTTVNSVETSKLLGFEIPVAPRGQQAKIVAEIEKQFSRLDEAVANLKRVKANLKRYKASVLKAAVEGKLTEDWRKQYPNVEPASKLLERVLTERRANWSGKGRYQEPAEPDTSSLPSLPEGWFWAAADQFCDFITKGTTPIAKKLREVAGDVPFLKVYNLTFTGRLNFMIKPTFVDRAVHEGELGRSKVKMGDVLINIVGPPLGQVAIVPDSLAEANINQAIARFRVLEPMSNHYVAVGLMSETIMGWAIKRAKTTAGQSNLTLELCRALPIPVPPIKEQKSIVLEVERRLSVIEELEATVEANLTRADRLRQSILTQAFSGKLLLGDLQLHETAAIGS